MLELLATHPIETYLLNTGRVGGKDDDERSKKVKIPHTSACVKGIAEQTISWVRDDDFGYLVADGVPEFDDVELLQPRRLYEREGRLLEYTEAVEHLKAERVSRPRGVPRALARDRQGCRLGAASSVGPRRPRNHPAPSWRSANTSGTMKYHRYFSSSSSAARPWTSIVA